MTPEEQEIYDSMRAAAHSFHTASVLLQDGTNILAKEVLKRGIDIRSSFISSALLYALSAEISLKTLAKRECVRIERLHDLKSLYNILPTEIRNRIQQDIEGYDECFDTLLEANKSTFVEWRYFYEKDNLSVNLDFLRKFSSAVNNECNKVEF